MSKTPDKVALRFYSDTMKANVSLTIEIVDPTGWAAKSLSGAQEAGTDPTDVFATVATAEILEIIGDGVLAEDTPPQILLAAQAARGVIMGGVEAASTGCGDPDCPKCRGKND